MARTSNSSASQAIPPVEGEPLVDGAQEAQPVAEADQAEELVDETPEAPPVPPAEEPPAPPPPPVPPVEAPVAPPEVKAPREGNRKIKNESCKGLTLTAVTGRPVVFNEDGVANCLEADYQRFLRIPGYVDVE